MKRFAWVAAVCSVVSAAVLSACGGGLSSPDFEGQLVGVGIVFPNSQAGARAQVAPGSTFNFDAVGLITAAPGTPVGTAGVVACPSVQEPARVCTQGTVSGVSWSVDPNNSVNGPFAGVDSSGLASGLRRGLATVRAQVAGLEDATVALAVDGPVLRSIRITSVDARNSVAATSVPTGRSFTLTGIPTCESGFPGGGVTNPPDDDVPCSVQRYQFRWSLPVTTDAATVEFLPASATGESISVKTKRFGPFDVIASLTNEEGQLIEAVTSPSLRASERVLDDVVISADPAQAAPVPVLIGTKTRFVAMGVFSDGSTEIIRAGDLAAPLVWSADSAAVGKFIIECGTPSGTCTDAPSPNSAVLVSGDVIGTSGLNTRSNNIETTPTGGLILEDRIAVDVRTLGLLRLVDICPFNSVGTECMQNPQLPVGTTTRFKARGSFSDNPDVPRDIDPSRIALTWSTTTTPTSGQVNVISAGTPPVTTGEFSAVRQGNVTLNVEIADVNIEPTATPRQVSAAATVVEAVCRDQLLTPATTATGSSNQVENVGNVIDVIPDSFGTLTVSAGLLGSDESMTFQRTATTVTPAAGGLSIGFLIAHEDVFNPEASTRIETLNPAGQIVQTFDSPTASTLGVPARNGGQDTLVALKASATLPFTGIRLVVEIPDLGGPTGTPLDLLLGPLLALLGLGGSTDVHAYAACANLP